MQCVYKLARKRRWGHRIIREEDLPPKSGPFKITKKGIKELVETGLLNVKKGLGARTYSLNTHRKKEIYRICEYVKGLEMQ